MKLLTAPGPAANQATLATQRYFNFVRANRPEDIEATYRIRYQVYCLERGFLDRDAYPEQLERDEFDQHALHILASHTNGAPAGSARLVRHSGLGFPLTQHCQLSLPSLSDCSDASLGAYAEISRLAVSKVFRRRQGDSFFGGPPRQHAPEPSGAEVIDFPVAPNPPEIVSGIYRALYQESKRHGIVHWLVAMERSLFVVLKRMGFTFAPIGPEVDYFGPVRPYLATISAFEDKIFRSSPSLFAFMIEGLESDLLPPCMFESAQAWAEAVKTG